MNRNERLLLLAWFVVVLVVFLSGAVLATALGTAAGVALALPLARSRLLLGRRQRGDLVVPGGIRPRRVGATIGVHLALMLVLVVIAALVPGLDDAFRALFGSAITAGAATITALRLKR